MLALVTQLGTSDADGARQELEGVVEEFLRNLDGGSNTAEDRVAFLWAGLALAGDDPDLLSEVEWVAEEVFGEIGAFHTVNGLCDLAETALLAGQLELADRATLYCEELPKLDDAWTVVPRIWYLNAEAARKAGRWDDCEAGLERLGKSVLPDEVFTGDYEPFLPANQDFRARYHVGRARLKLAYGLLEQAKVDERAARAAAESCGWPGTLALVRHLSIDVAMFSQMYTRGIQLSEGVVDEPWFAELPDQHRILFRVAEGICRSEQERHELLGLARPTSSLELEDSRARQLLREVLESGHLVGAEVVRIHVQLADGALARGEHAAALEHLRAIGELRGKVSPSAPRDLTLAAPVRWRALWELRSASPEDGPGDEELDAARTGLVDAFEAQLRHWRTIAPRSGGIGFHHFEWRTQVLETLIDATRAHRSGEDGVERAFERVLQVQGMGSIARGRNLATPSLDEVRETLLADGRALVVLVPGRTRSHLFVLHGEAIECYERPPFDKLKALAAPVMTALRPKGRPMNRAAIEELRDALFPPSVAERLAGWNQVYAIGFDRIVGLAVHCLPVAGDRLLAEATALSVLPSLPLAVDRQRAGSQRGKRKGDVDAVFAIAPDPHGVGSLDELPFGRDERAALLDAFDAGRVRLLSEEKATAAALRRPGALDDVPLLFVLAHTTPDDENASLAMLVLGKEGASGPDFLRLEDVRALEYDGVVILASCRAASGPARLGDDALAHLGGAFLEGGALAVVLAREQVEYKATLALFEHALERLAAGDSTAEAMRAAYAATLGDEPWKELRRTGYQVLGLGFEAPLERRE